MAVTLHGNEIVWVTGISQDEFPSPIEEQTTTAAIAALGGGGGVGSFSEITTGTTVLGILLVYYGWNSSTSGPKFILAPPATGTLETIRAIDMAGDAGDGSPITFVPDGSDIIIGNQNQIYTDNGSAAWRDLAPGIWGLD